MLTGQVYVAYVTVLLMRKNLVFVSSCSRRAPPVPSGDITTDICQISSRLRRVYSWMAYRAYASSGRGKVWELEKASQGNHSGPFPIGCQMLTGVMRKKQVMAVAARRGLKANMTSMLGPPDCSTYERCPGTDVGVGGGRRFSDVWMFGNVARDD